MKIIAVFFLVLSMSNLFAEPSVFVANNLAIGGVDVVAYFTKSRPMMGDKKYTTQWRDAQWNFSSQEHLDLFQAKPENYAPQFGGFCALTTAHRASIQVDPRVWTIYKGRLYFFVFASARDTWLMDPDKLIKRAGEFY